MTVKFLLALSVFLLSIQATAQSPSRIEVFGGYSYTGYSVYDLYSGPWEQFGFGGWEASATAKLMPHLGVEADFSGVSSSPYGHSTTIRTYMGGPRVSAAFGRVTVYGHLLFGGLSFADQGYSSTVTSFATAFGGGADLWFSRHIGVRPIAADYLRNTNSAAGQGLATSGGGNHFRISTGVVLRF